MKSLAEMKAELSTERQACIEDRASELIAEEYVLKALRTQRHFSQTELAKVLDMNQSAISRLESRKDFLLSTLNTYIKALGGELKIEAYFPDQAQTVDLSATLAYMQSLKP
jgi:transcriptional regulator with XRE-family HTH domain